MGKDIFPVSHSHSYSDQRALLEKTLDEGDVKSPVVNTRQTAPEGWNDC